MPHEVEVLILTSGLDFATDRVCRELSARGISFLRLNREQLVDLSLELDPLRAVLRCRTDGADWDVGTALRAVWWRQGTFDRTPGNAADPVEQLEKSQWSAFMRSMMVFPAALWINHPAAVYAAEVKAVQLHIASRLGFDVPATRMTNDPAAHVTGVIGPHVALKSIDTLLLREGKEQLFGYTTLIDWTEIATPELKRAPVTVQQPLTEKLDLRVTVLGSRLWSVAIRKGNEGIEGDWRLTQKDDLVVEDYALPDDVATNCLALVDALGLRFGAIDLAVADGRHWFIEINPTGEWGWLDTPSRTLSVAIAEELSATSPAPRRR